MGNSEETEICKGCSEKSEQTLLTPKATSVLKFSPFLQLATTEWYIALDNRQASTKEVASRLRNFTVKKNSLILELKRPRT